MWIIGYEERDGVRVTPSQLNLADLRRDKRLLWLGDFAPPGESEGGGCADYIAY